MPGRMDFGIEFAKPEAQPVVRKRSDGPMRILILGDFSGITTTISHMIDQPQYSTRLHGFTQLLH